MVYLEATERMFVVTDSSGTVDFKSLDYEAALHAAMREAEFARDHLTILTGGKLWVEDGLVIIGRAGFGQIRSVIKRRKKKLKLQELR